MSGPNESSQSRGFKAIPSYDVLKDLELSQIQVNPYNVAFGLKGMRKGWPQDGVAHGRSRMITFVDNGPFDFLTGMELTEVTFGQYAVHFTFKERESIVVESCFEHDCAATGRTTLYQADGPQKEFIFYPLLGLRITDAVIVSQDRLKLEFENGDALFLIRAGDGYESVNMSGPGHLHITVI